MTAVMLSSPYNKYNFREFFIIKNKQRKWLVLGIWSEKPTQNVHKTS